MFDTMTLMTSRRSVVCHTIVMLCFLFFCRTKPIFCLLLILDYMAFGYDELFNKRQDKHLVMLTLDNEKWCLLQGYKQEKIEILSHTRVFGLVVCLVVKGQSQRYHWVVWPDAVGSEFHWVSLIYYLRLMPYHRPQSRCSQTVLR